MSEDIQFVCSACEKDCEEDTRNVVTQCRVCRRLHCNDCVDEYGRCVECAD